MFNDIITVLEILNEHWLYVVLWSQKLSHDVFAGICRMKVIVEMDVGWAEGGEGSKSGPMMKRVYQTASMQQMLLLCYFSPSAPSMQVIAALSGLLPRHYAPCPRAKSCVISNNDLLELGLAEPELKSDT